MRFQTTEMVPLQDPEIVLRALEYCLRDVSPDVTRTGPEIVLHGLGPSPLAVNRRDTTVLHVKTEDDKTIIDADVHFQASALLGDTPQHEVVRSKLDRVFDRMKMQIEAEKRKESHTRLSRAETTPLAAVDSQVPASDPPRVSPVTEAQSLQPEPEAATAEPELVLIVPALEERQAPTAELPALRSTLTAATAPIAEGTLHSDVTASESTPSPERHTKRYAPVAAIAASLLLVLPGLYLAAHLHPPRRVLAAHAAPAYATPHIVPPVTTEPIVPPATTTSAPSEPKAQLQVSDPKAWLQNWVAATRTRDAAAQASFYADPVDHYLGKRDISNADVLAEKRAAILNREGLWTVKLEEIGMHRINDNNVSIYLVKHFMAETEPAQISEQFVPSHLELRRINGEWKITSEEDLQPTATPSDHVPSD